MVDPNATEVRQLIESNFVEGRGSFLGALRMGELDRDLLNELVYAVARLNTTGMEHVERSGIAVLLWEFDHRVLCECRCHFDPEDVARITNASSREIRAVTTLLYWLCNRFSYALPIADKELLLETYLVQ